MASGGFDIFLFVPSVPLSGTPNGVCTYASNLIYLFRNDRDININLVAKASLFDESGRSKTYVYYLPRDSFLGRILIKIFGVGKYEEMMAWRFGWFIGNREVKQRRLIEMEEVFGQSLIVKKYAGKVPVVVRLHGPWFLVGDALGVAHDQGYLERVRREGDAIYAADAVSAPSAFVLNAVEEFYNRKITNKRVIANPFPEYRKEELWELIEGNMTVLFVGRFDLVKGADIFIEAMFDLKKHIHGVRAFFVGPDINKIRISDGTVVDRAAFVAWCEKKYGQSSPIEFLGKKSPNEIVRLRKQVAACVVPSRMEMFSYTVAEALAQGVPTVASRVGGIPEIITDGENGLLFESENIQNLSSCIERILSAPSLAINLSKNALSTVGEKFSREALVRVQLDFYQSVIGQ